MYARCGSLEAAWSVFNSMHSRDVVIWTLLMLRLIESGESEQALKLYARMQDEGCKPDTPTFIAALKAFGSTGCLESGKALHADICRYGLESETRLLDGYGKSGSMVEAKQVFDSILKRDSITFTFLIAGYSRVGHAELVLGLFQEMLEEGLKPDGVTFLCILAACSHAGLVEEAQKCFSKMLEFGIAAGLDHYHCMIDVLARANKLENAMRVAETMPHEANAVTWRTVLGACKKWKNVVVGRAAFDRLVRLNPGDVAAYMLMESICSQGMRSLQGSRIHSQVVEAGIRDKFVESMLVDMYAKCGSMVQARSVFESMVERDIVSWNVLLHGYVENEEAHMTVELFHRLEEDGCAPNARTYVAAIKACGNLIGAGKKFDESGVSWLERSKAVHSRAVIDSCCNMFVGSSLVDLYSKAGCMDHASDG